MSGKKQFFVGLLVTLALGATVVGVLVAMGAIGKEKDFDNGKTVEVSANTLRSDYEDNPVRADQRYTGCWVKVQGEINRIDSDAVYLRSGTRHLITCKFRDRSEIAKLSNGQQVTLIGKCPGGRAALQDCRQTP